MDKTIMLLGGNYYQMTAVGKFIFSATYAAVGAETSEAYDTIPSIFKDLASFNTLSISVVLR